MRCWRRNKDPSLSARRNTGLINRDCHAPVYLLIVGSSDSFISLLELAGFGSN